MALERTLTILKPDCVRKKLIGTVIEQIQEAGFEIKAMKLTRLTKDTASGFYAVHKERPFFGELVEFGGQGLLVAEAALEAGPEGLVHDHGFKLPEVEVF